MNWLSFPRAKRERANTAAVSPWLPPAQPHSNLGGMYSELLCSSSRDAWRSRFETTKNAFYNLNNTVLHIYSFYVNICEISGLYKIKSEFDVQSCLLGCRSTIILHGSTTQKTALNIILAAVRTWNLTKSELTVILSLVNCSTKVKKITSFTDVLIPVRISRIRPSGLFQFEIYFWNF
jgi:hypothetical protein